MTLWGNKNPGEEDERPATNGGSGHEHAEREDPTERTRLLQERPPPVRNDGYLDPDDPAVSGHELRFMAMELMWLCYRCLRTIYGRFDS
jgi:hypothetical protein